MKTETRFITGKVTDEKGEPLLGVNIVVKNSQPIQGTATDSHGIYKLTVPVGSQLVFSFIGRQTMESSPITKTSSKFPTVVLREVAEELDGLTFTAPKKEPEKNLPPTQPKKENPIQKYYNPQTTITQKNSYNQNLKDAKLLMLGGGILLFGLLIAALNNSQIQKVSKKVNL